MNKNLLRLTALAGAMLLTSGAFAAVATYNGTGLPLAIPDAAGPATSTASEPGPGNATNVTDVNLTVNITHTWASDIGITLASVNPTVGATAIINDCGGSGDYVGTNTVFDDAAAAAPGCTFATFNPTGTFRATASPTALAAFNGAAAAALHSWTVNVVDDSAICTGTLNAFSVTVTSDLPLPVELSEFSID